MASKRKSRKTNKSKGKEKKEDITTKIAQKLINTGVIFVFLAALIFLFIFLPVIHEEARYFFSESKDTKVSSESIALFSYESSTDSSKIVPADENFSIIVPKIGANSKIVENVDPYNPSEYQQKLTQGVAHAKGSALPGERGNTFLFAHSSDNFYNANRYNSVFYLLNKLELSDNFFIIRNGDIYEYSVSEKSIVSAERIDYLENNSRSQTATLMTCWPPGTTLQRLILVGDLVNVSKH